MGQKINKERHKDEEKEEEEEENEDDSSNDNEKNIDEIDAENVNDKENENEENETSDPKKKKKKKKKSKKKEEQPVKMDKIEQLLCDTFQNTDIDFNYKEVLTIKLRVNDAEKYFIREFNCLFYFNSYIFQQRLNILYENYSANVEKFLKKTVSQNISTNFLILVDFDDETEMPQGGYYSGSYEINSDGNIGDSNNPESTNLATYSTKIEYESLFTIIFEPLEIPTALFFLMTNHNQKTCSDFFSQLYENIYLNKGNRKYDIMYFLLPNLDFFVRNETYVIYIVNQSNQFDESLDMLSNYTISYSNQYTESLYCSLYFKEMLNVNYDRNNIYGNSIINSFLKNIIEPSFVQSIFKFDSNLSNQFEDFVIEYEREIEIINKLISISNVNTIIIRLDNFSQDDQKNEGISQFIKKILLMHDKIHFAKSVLIIRLLCLENFENKNYEKLTIKLNDLVNELIKESFIFSSRERLRKNIIECLYYEKDQKKGEKSEDIVENDDLNTSHENLNAKMGTKVKYKKEKIFCTYFLGDKQIHKMKKYIYNILNEKINDKKSFHNLFKLLFDKKYFLTNLSSKKGTDTHYKIEKMFYI
jgi:hypothetical protein